MMIQHVRSGSRSRGSLRFSIHRPVSAGLAVVLLSGFLAVMPSATVPAAAALPQFVDQTLKGDPGCDQTHFPGGQLTSSALRQEFVPSRAGVTGIDLCLQVVVSASITVNVRAGTAATPGTILGSKSVTPGTGFSWVHFDLSSAATTTPGTKYVLEVPAFPANIYWRVDCGSLLSACSQTSPDLYPAGTTNRTSQIGSNGDFGFRTYTPAAADLTGSIAGPKVACEGKAISGATASVTNAAASATGPFSVGIYLSTDQTITTADTALAHITVPSLAGNTTQQLTLPTLTIPSSRPEGRAYLGTLVDENNTVVEQNETNNTANAPVAVFCGHAGFSAIGLSADQSTIPAGSYRVPVDSIPLDAIGFAATGTEDTGLHNSGLHNSGLHNSGLHNSPLHNSLIGAPASALSSIHLSDIPIFLVGGWTKLLNGTSLANKLPQDVTLGEFLNLNPHPAVSIGDIDIENSPLKLMTFAGVATAGISLNRLAAQVGSPPQAWCPSFLGGQGYSCTDYGIDPATTSLLDLNLLGVAATVPWSTMKFSGMNLDGSPMYAIKLIDYAIRQTPAAQFPLSALNSPATFTTCTTCNTLGEAEAAGKIVDGPTLGDLVHNLKTASATLGATTLGDYLMGAMPDRNEWPVGALGLGRANLFSGTGLPVTYHATMTATSGTGTAPLVDPQISVTLPPGYQVVPGTSQVIYPAGSAARALSEPSVSGSKTSWTLSDVVAKGSTAEVVFKAAPGLDLGSAGSNVSAHAVDEFGSVDAAPLTNQAIVRVVDTETIGGQANDAITTAPYLESRVRRLGYISSSTDTDYYRIPVPTGPGCTLDPASTAASPAGCLIEVLMSPVVKDGSDSDLVLYGPSDDPLSSGLHNSGLHNSGLHNSPLQDDPSSGATATDVPPETLADIGLHNSGLHNSGLHNSGVRDYSVQRGSTDEAVRTTTVGGEKGFFTLQVTGYNGNTSVHPYAITIYSSPPPALAACTPRAYNAGSYAASAPTVPSDFTTLILVDENRMAKIYGTSAVTGSGGLLDHLTTLASRTNGFIYPIETNADYAAAMTAWDQNPCDITLANAASTKLATLVSSTVANKPSFKYVVIVGSDEAVASYRMIDKTSVANELNNVDSLVAAQNNTSITSAAAGSTYLTDDIYATDTWLDANGDPLFVPKWSVGRLVETIPEIDGTIDQFDLSNGRAEQPPAQTALVTGYDFLTDGATAAADSEAAQLGSDKVARLICENWTRQDLIDNLVGPQAATPSSCLNANAPAPPPDIAGLNGHADNYRLLPAAGNASGSQSDLFTSADVTSLPLGRIIFSMGCHFGLNLPDSAVAAADANPTRLNDWAQALSKRAAILVANTGYGYGDDVSVAYSEQLMSQFAKNLDGTRSVGEAFRDAKQSYYLSNFGTYGPYDLKALQEAVFYGLPMFTTAGTGGALAPQTALAPTGPGSLTPDSTGLPAKAFDSGTLGFTPKTTTAGTYYAASGGLLIKDRRPIVAQEEYDATNTDPAYPGYKAIGLFPTSQSTSVVSGNDPVFASAEYATGRPEEQSVGVFPTSPGAITTLDNTQRLLLWPARFTPTSAVGSQIVTGDLALRNRVQGVLYYSNVDGLTPQIQQVTVQSPDATHLSVQVRTSSPDAPVKRVGVLVGGAFADLLPAGTDLWTGTLTVANSAQRSDVLVSAVAATGVGYWADKGTPIATSSSNQGLSIKVCADGATACSADGPTTNGWYPTAIRADASGPVPTSAIDVSVDGQSSSNPAHVTQTGVHEIGARAYDSSSGSTLSAARTVLVDVTKPNIMITSPEARPYEINSTVTPSSSCTDAGSGVQSCSGPGTVDTSTQGQHSYTVTATDLAGNTNTGSVNYTVVDTTPPTISITSPTATTYEAGTTVYAAYTCSDSGSGIDPTACVGSVANGSPIDMTIGTHTFTVDAMDRAGNQAPQARVTYTVADRTAPTIAITTPADGALYALNATVKASYSCSDSSGVATCSGPVANGANIVTSSSGTFTFTVNATDTAGNASTKTATYKVALKFTGFYSPVSNPPTLNRQTAGNTEPFKFNVYNNGTEITSTTGFSFSWKTINCSTKAPIVPDPFTQTATSNPGFRYDTSAKQLIFNAVTDKSWMGYCRQFTVTLPDGSTQFAYLQLT
jgi:hypothetical protein